MVFSVRDELKPKEQLMIEKQQSRTMHSVLCGKRGTERAKTRLK
jgi:hypothetical protein